MAAQPIGPRFDKGWPVTAPGASDRRIGSAPHALDVVAIDGLRRDAEGGGSRHDRARRHGVGRREFTVAIVLADENDRQPPQRRNIERFQQYAAIGCPVAEEAATTFPSPSRRAENAAPVAIGMPAPTMPLAPRMPFREIGDMHRAAKSLADVGAPVDLCEEGFGVPAFGKKMTMAAMRAGDPVAIAQMRADADRDGFLAHISVDVSGQHALFEIPDETFLDFAD